jgi:hypothetical protein
LDSLTKTPVLIYDDRCSSCTVFAAYAFKLSRRQIDCMGHYSKEGQKFKKMIFPPNYKETEMFWIISNSYAYGGRSALLPLLVLIIKGIFKAVIKNKISHSQSMPAQCFDNFTCNDNKFKLKRLVNLLRRGRKLKVNFVRSVNE